MRLRQSAVAFFKLVSGDGFPPILFFSLFLFLDVIEQYLKLKPLFETVFAEFDLDDNGVLDQQEFKRFEKALS